MARGRPQDPDKQLATKQALCQAARELLELKPYRSITIRELAHHAGTQSAMVSYYFGSKEGLFIELLEQSGNRRQQKMMMVAQQVLAQPNQALTLLVDNLIELMASEPWVVKLLQDEILSQESKLRDGFLSAIPQRLKTALSALLGQLQRQGILRADLNLDFTVATLMSNILFPMLTEPLMSHVLGIQRNTLRSEAWKQHLTQVLTQGLSPAGAAQ